MRHPRITAAAITVAVAAAVGGVTVAAAAGPSSPRYPAAATGSGPLSVAGPASSGAATVQIATTVVHGTPESILEDANGLPLYTYQADTPTTSRVSGQLAALWPPLVATSPTAAGATGMLRSLSTGNGRQVSYNGHFLYTFVQDSPGHVTGQGVQDFLVATPDLPLAGTAPTPAPSTAPAGHGYGY